MKPPYFVRDGHDRDVEMIAREGCRVAHAEVDFANSTGGIGRFCKVGSSQAVEFG